MFRIVRPAFITVLLTFSTTAFSEANTVAEAISGGEGHLSFRYRYEGVDQDNISKEANASTLKTRLNYRSAALNGYTLFVEVDDVSNIGDDSFNSTRNGKGNYPVVADPDGTDMNQFYLNYKGENNSVTFGRQRILLDNQRYVGGVGWRQNEQTYDAITVQNTAIDNLTVKYSYLNKINRIFGPDDGAAARAFDSNSHLLNAKLNMQKNGSLVFYGYFLDLEDAAALSNRTFGLRYSNTYDMDGFKMPVNLEFARQEDYGDNASSYDANYMRAEIGVSVNTFSVMFGAEELEGSNTGGEMFTTPLATLHGQNGWADQFLGTPAGGIEDMYVSFGKKFKNSKLTVVYHDFSAETGSMDYGTELDIAWNYKISKNYGVLLKAASFESDDGYKADVDKIWVMFTANF